MRTTVTMLESVTPQRLVPDWVPVWPDRIHLLTRMKGMSELVDRLLVPPAKIDAFSGQSEGTSPAGFSVALLPYLDAVGAKTSADRQRLRISAMGGIPWSIMSRRSVYLRWVGSSNVFGLQQMVDLIGE